MISRPPIWLISLPRAVDRRAFVTEGFAELGIDFEMIDGVDGWELTEAQLARCSQWRALLEVGRRLPRGDLGCSLSHLSIYERMVEENLPAVVVMEDDALPTTDLLKVLDASASFPDDWDVITFSTHFASAGPTPIDDSVIAEKYRICTYRNLPFGTQCYLVNFRAAHRLLEVGFPVCMPPDDLLFRPWPAGLRVYGVEPRLALDGEFRSELEARSEMAASRGLSGGLVDRLVVAIGKVRHRVRKIVDRRRRGVR